MEFAVIPAGTVRLADARRGTERTVALRSFRLGTVTVGAAELEAGRAGDVGTGRGLVPAVGVTWLEAVRWCNSASDHAGARYGELSRIAWTADDDLAGPQPAGGKAANAFGLFDVLGNAWEWCWDRLDPARYGDYRVLKGGGWADPE